MYYYLVTNNNCVHHLVRSKRDLTEREIDDYLAKHFGLPEEHPVFWVSQMWVDEEPFIEIE
jgi:hypothetical protein